MYEYRADGGAPRLKNRFELAKIVEGWMQSQPSDEAVLKILEEHRVAAAPDQPPPSRGLLLGRHAGTLHHRIGPPSNAEAQV